VGLSANELGLVVNLQDHQSVQVANYYQTARGIPEANIIKVSFEPSPILSKQMFEKIKAEIDAATPSHIQGFAISWTSPYRVGCMSITSAIAMGYDDAYCAHCKPTKPSEYFNASSTSPYTDFKIRPAMMLAGTNFEQVKALIDKGVASDSTMPKGNAFLLNTSDKNRNVRAVFFEDTKKALNPAFSTYVVKANDISFKQQVMFYFTGVTHVKHLDTLKFLPGALADHLTSAGGVLLNSGQMSVLRWLEAGATASYGAVVEPCNYREKFPMPGVAMFHYMTGASALEAYWKSVAWPGEGIFVGEPLARPFAPKLSEGSDNTYELSLFSPTPKVMLIEQADSLMGIYQTLGQKTINAGVNQMQFKLKQDSEVTKYFQLRW
jgi:uncharacterized protein (TIGR03790 family)